MSGLCSPDGGNGHRNRLGEFIRSFIEELVQQHRGSTCYRTPLVGFAAAQDPGFARLKEVVGGNHLLPEDLLAGSRSVVAFFLPFTPELVSLHRRQPGVSREWVVAYRETNSLIEKICRNLGEALGELGVTAAWQPATHNFDPVSLSSRWSHKHIAYLCGLGTFGLHQMLITRAGCAGRVGSLVLDAGLPATPRPDRGYCLERRGRRCSACIRRCPTGALTPRGLDKTRCYRWLREVDRRFSGQGLGDACGQCAVGACALGIPD